MLSPQFGVAPTLNFNLWFYPTANNVIILGELGQTTENSNWHLTMLEINSSNKLKGRVWQMPSGVTSTGSVNLNAWNHVYFYYDHGTTTFGMSLNNETAVTQGGVSRHVSDTNHTYWGIGLYDPGTNMGSGDRYQGKFDGLVINTSIVGSNYTATKAKYLPPLSLNFPAGDPYLLVSNTQSDWNLGNTYTIEFWSKSDSASSPSAIRTVMSQGPNSGNIDLGYMFGGLLVSNSQIGYPEPSVGGVPSTLFNLTSQGGWDSSPYTNLATTGGTGTGLKVNAGYTATGYLDTISIHTPGSGYTSGDVITITNENNLTASFTIGICSARGIWTHVAFVRNGVSNAQLYYNGVNQTQFSMSLNNGSSDLNIGRRAGVNGQGFLGKLAMIRISSTAKYLDNFSPSLSYGVEGDTRLMLGSNNPLVDGAGTHPISVQGAVTTSPDFPSFQSLQFDQPDGDFMYAPAGNDWNLGTTGTIEFWIKANNASSANIHIPGGQWGLINQGGWYYGMPDNNCILIGLAGGNLSIAQSSTDDVQYTEPTAGVWTHVAVVYNSGTQKVYYNGVEQTKTSGNYLGNGWTNTTSDLYIGRLAPNYQSHFDGKLAMVRISSTAKYLTTFTATTTYGVEGDTRLFLDKVNPTVDSKAHSIFNNGVALSSDFPT